MANDQIQKEAEELREASGTSASEPEHAEDSGQTGAAAGTEQPTVETPSSDETPVAPQKDVAEPSAQLKELLDALDLELKKTNPIILLGVFALGVFVGRILPR